MMIELKNITKRYRHQGQWVTALDNISLTVHPGEILGVIGKSGAGKSTLVRCVNLLEHPCSGEVWVNNENLSTLSATALRAQRKNIGMVFQHFNLLNSRTAFDNIALNLELNGETKKVIETKVQALLELTGLTQQAHFYPSQLSGGQKQRVAIARALASEPNVLLCDEITSALDPHTTFAILQLLLKIQSKLKLAVLFISHDINVIKAISDQVIVLDQGKVVEYDNIINIFKNPKAQITQSLTQASLHCELPIELKNNLQTQPGEKNQAIIRVKFLGQSAVEPVMDDLIRHKNLKINIFQANLEYIQNDTIGMMILSAQGQQEDIQQALRYLNQKNCDTEILGYINELGNTTTK